MTTAPLFCTVHNAARNAHACLRTALLLCCILLVSAGGNTLDCIALAAPCEIPPGADTSAPPPFWCALRANVTLGPSCSLRVEETFRVPWTPSELHRVLVKQSTQTIRDITVAQVTNGARVAIPLLDTASPDNLAVDLALRPQPRKSPSLIVLRYTVLNGVMGWMPCATDTAFGADPQQPRDRVAVWRPGGLSVAHLAAVSAQFWVPAAVAAANLTELAVQAPPHFNGSLVRVANRTSLFLAHHSAAAVRQPERLIYYLRFAHMGGRAPCPQYRNCRQEVRASGMVLQRAARRSVPELALAIGLACFVALFGCGIVVLCWRIRRKRSREDGNAHTDLPTAFRHFAYDTGDAKSSKLWKQWAADPDNTPPPDLAAAAASAQSAALGPKVERAESVFVRDISPRGANGGRSSV